MLAGLRVEHELRQRAMQASDGTSQHRKASSRQLGGGLEVES
jgi:hypothetical protein